MHNIGTILFLINSEDFNFKSLFFSLKICLLSEWPIIQKSIFNSDNDSLAISPVNEPDLYWETFCAPT